MTRQSLPAHFRAEGLLLPWRSISSQQIQRGDSPEELANKRKQALSSRHTEVHLRWACHPEIGVPLSPFDVWMRSVNGRAGDVRLQWTSFGNKQRTTLPQAASMVIIELERANAGRPVAVFGLRGSGDMRRTLAAQSRIPGNPDRFTLTLRADGITDLLVLNGSNPTVRMQSLTDTLNDSAWKRVETVGLPVDGTWGSSDYTHVDQGITGAEIDPLKAAILRLQRGAPPMGWPFLTETGQVAPAWEPIEPEKLIDELHTDLMPLLEQCFEGVAAHDQNSIRPVMQVDPPQQQGRSSTARTSAALAPLQLLMLAATTESALALATGFGTAWSLEPSPFDGLAKGKSEFMVSANWKGHPDFGDRELASYIPWPDEHLHVERPAGMIAEHDGLVRPQTIDDSWQESVRVRWNRVASTASLGRPTGSAFIRYDDTSPQTVSLMPQRDAGGVRPFLLSQDGPDGQANADKNALVDTPVALPLDGSATLLGYSVAVQDVFGVWSPWSDASHTGAAPKAPGLGLISLQLDTSFTGSQSACPSIVDMQVAIDWSSRTPKSFELFMGFFPMSSADSVVPATLSPDAPIPSGMFRREMLVSFSGDQPTAPKVQALDADGLNLVTAGPAQGMGTRRYRVQLNVPELDFSSTPRWGVRIWGRLESRVVPGFSPWGPVNGADGKSPPVAVAVAANPSPITPLPLPVLPGVPMGGQPDSNGQSHVKVYWPLPSGPRPDKINIWESTETLFRQRAGLTEPDPGTLPGARLLKLRELYDALPQDDRRLRFRRFKELPGTARMTDIALPKGSTEIHFFTITTTTRTGVESPWPVGNAEQRLHAFIAPALVAPAAPMARASAPDTTGAISISVATTSAIPVETFQLYRSVSAAASRRIGSMGPPFAQINAEPPALSDPPDAATGQPVYRALWEGNFPADWRDWFVRVVAVPVDSVADSAQRGQISATSDITELAVRPATIPDLAPLMHEDWGESGTGILINTSTDLFFAQSPSGAHRLLATVGTNKIEFNNIIDIPLSDGSAPADAGDGPVLLRSERVSGRTPISLWFKRDDPLQAIDVSLTLIDPFGRMATALLTVPPWQTKKLTIRITDVLKISGRGTNIIFTADAPVSSREPGTMSIALNSERFNNILQLPKTTKFVLHKIPFNKRPTFSGSNDEVVVNRVTDTEPYSYAMLIRGAQEPSLVITIEMSDGVSGSARHNPRPVIGPPINRFNPPDLRFPR